MAVRKVKLQGAKEVHRRRYLILSFECPAIAGSELVRAMAREWAKK